MAVSINLQTAMESITNGETGEREDRKESSCLLGLPELDSSPHLLEGLEEPKLMLLKCHYVAITDSENS